jgi:LCP family protein required for cell wall assembly
MLNGVFTWALDNRELFGKAKNPGVDATIMAVEGITGLKINYYAMVNLQGFRSMVQAVGGLTLNVRDRIPIGGIGHEVTGYIEPGVQKLDGFHALWFARSRVAADDYSRMARQKCVMNAMLQQLSPRTVVTKFEDIAVASEKLVTTDLPASELGKFGELAMKARSQPIRTVSFVPPAIVTSDPDVTKIQSMVRTALAKAEGGVGSPADSTTTGTKDGGGDGGGTGGYSQRRRSTVGGSVGSLKEGYAANASSDLSSSC